MAHALGYREFDEFDENDNDAIEEEWAATRHVWSYMWEDYLHNLEDAESRDIHDAIKDAFAKYF